MNTRAITTDYRLQQWAGIIREFRESGLRVKDFCETSNISYHQYYYWQRKLREAACEELTERSLVTAPGMMPAKFTEVKLSDQTRMQSSSESVGHNQVCIEASGIRFIANGEYPVENLVVMLREARQLC